MRWKCTQYFNHFMKLVIVTVPFFQALSLPIHFSIYLLDRSNSMNCTHRLAHMRDKRQNVRLFLSNEGTQHTHTANLPMTNDSAATAQTKMKYFSFSILLFLLVQLFIMLFEIAKSSRIRITFEQHEIKRLRLIHEWQNKAIYLNMFSIKSLKRFLTINESCVFTAIDNSNMSEHFLCIFLYICITSIERSNIA